MRIQHNVTALNAHRNLFNNNTSVGKNLEKLSSGYRINRAGDDAAGLAISEKMRAQITGLETAQKNASDGISLVQTAEGALTEVHSMLNRMVELATQSANGTYQSTNRDQMQTEIVKLQDEIKRIAKSSDFNGLKLFAADTTIKLQVSDQANDTIDVDMETLTTKLADSLAIDIKTDTGAQTAIDKVKADIDKVSTLRSDFGAAQNRLEHTLNYLGVQTENITAAESRIRDVDMAKEMMAYTKNNILVQASQAMLAQANQVPQGVLQLLQ